MAFESLSEKFQRVFKNLRGKGRLSEDDVKAAMKEVRMALLEADVNFKVVKDFTKDVTEKVTGTDILNGLNPAQTVIKQVADSLTELMGGEVSELPMAAGQGITVIMMVGLQGAGKTTSAVKLAGHLIKRGKKPLLAACDVYRPAAIDQLKKNAEKLSIPVFSLGTEKSPVEIAEMGYLEAKKSGNDVYIIDTAGRLQIDEGMMQELSDIKERVEVMDTLLTVDAMTGQEAVNVASAFQEKVGIDGIILTKLDGDTRGGAALSVKAVTGKPVYFSGMGEKLDDLEPFYPDRMAKRILGMGDVFSLIEKAEAAIDKEKAEELSKKVGKAEFDFNDYLLSLEQMKQMGGLSSVMGLLPSMPGVSKKKLDEITGNVDESEFLVTEALIKSMTPEERAKPDILNPSRKNRIARGAGVDISVVNRFVKQFEQSKKMMKQFAPKKGKKRRSFGGFPGFGGMPF
ncbi:MAG: signal recognition particle protein [Lachnospiraceae bacterium]|nr:signal recognition particle protein [Lachnospiraceae bacterium]